MATIKHLKSTPSLHTLQAAADRHYTRLDGGNSFLTLRIEHANDKSNIWLERPSDKGRAVAAFLRVLNALTALELTGDTLLEMASQQLRLEEIRYQAELNKERQ